jgi:hypothetical protein
LKPAELTVDFNFLAVGDPGGGICIVIPFPITNFGARGTTSVTPREWPQRSVSDVHRIQ